MDQNTSLPPESDDVIYANGIFADTGLPLCQLEMAELADIAAARAVPKAEQQQAHAKY